MAKKITRRGFLRNSGATAAGAAGLSNLMATQQARAGANETVRLGLIGSGGRGTGNVLLALPFGAECVAVADPDDTHSARAAELMKAHGQKAAVQTYRDFRHVLDRQDIDAVFIGTPDHWHAIVAIMACQAGKDVFVEKPISHNIREGRAMVEAARKYKRIMQVGTQQRSAEHFHQAKEYLDSGKLGRICLAKAWVTYRDPFLGKPVNTTPPPQVDYDLWLGPAPKRPFNKNRFHYTWRWFWDYAGGKQADWGIHLIDIVHWYMGVNAPTTVSSDGGIHILTDNRTTPDTQITTFEYPEFTCCWEHRQGTGHGLEEDRDHGIGFYGENGTLIITRGGWQVYPEKEGLKPVKVRGKGETDMFMAHDKDFLNSVRTRKTPCADIEVGQRSTSACQLGNIAYLTGRKIKWDAAKEEIIGDKEAAQYLTREYRKPWELPAI